MAVIHYGIEHQVVARAEQNGFGQWTDANWWRVRAGFGTQMAPEGENGSKIWHVIPPSGLHIKSIKFV